MLSGDKCWPAASTWSKLNATIGGNLQVALPPGASCYNSLKDEGGAGGYQYSTSATCTRGYYGTYVVLAKTRQHIKATIDFARKNNIRLVIRNTGHDFMGRSTGYGSLVLNTHSFKDVTWHKKWAGPGAWKGGAVTVGAGIQGRELWRLANKQSPPQALVTGECPTVGFAGGFIQGGGHGPLASLYGLAADQALSFDVVTASGEILPANAVQNPSLFWALKGGGPSTFAAVISVTVKTFPDLPSAAVTLSINSTHTTDVEVYWKGVNAFHALANRYVENGMFVYYELLPLRLHVHPFVGPNMTAAQITEVVKPLFDKLDAEEVPYSSETLEFPTFFDLTLLIYTREDMRVNATAVNAAQRLAVENGAFIVGHIVGPGTGAPKVNNAIHPKWRKQLVSKAEAQRIVTNVIGKALREAAPNGAAYVNEGDLEEPNWQTEYWGSNYPRLLRLKKQYDPLGVFYARTTPGTEDWDIIDDGTRLCRKI
ncbi:FAD binding domain-containing protein [Coprinellus micaceus]|uniref:FAD binding domain-containing protein n=1 Tax=Coprinellus micaceus TaxID=71717 RepID=A0A4Y7R4J8_COPMI|nr:FAD binding domain-containing protein [Coprinellus micaceus]